MEHFFKKIVTILGQIISKGKIFFTDISIRSSVIIINVQKVFVEKYRTIRNLWLSNFPKIIKHPWTFIRNSRVYVIIFSAYLMLPYPVWNLKWIASAKIMIIHNTPVFTEFWKWDLFHKFVFHFYAVGFFIVNSHSFITFFCGFVCFIVPMMKFEFNRIDNFIQIMSY